MRKGNESLFVGHPYVRKVHVWDKRNRKFRNLLALCEKIREERFDVVVNLQRYASSGFLTVFSGAKEKIGFRKNPWSFFFNKRFEHEISAQGKKHEVDRNQKLIQHLTDTKPAKPKLYPSEEDFLKAQRISMGRVYCTISPASVWFTKQLPKRKWLELIERNTNDQHIFILGGPHDKALGDELVQCTSRTNITNLAGELSLLGSAALMQGAVMNYVNDSAPLHLCSALNAPVTAFFCSTVPAFGFTPLSSQSKILETKESLSCRPCGLHGFKACPRKHFKCSEIELP